MDRRLRNWQLAGFVFTAIFGTLLHFLFDWTGGAIVAALFSAINESIWEHMKLIFYPMLIFSVVQYKRIGSEFPNFWCVKLLGITLALILIPVIYYTYTGIFGTNVDLINITIFFLVAAFIYWLEYQLITAGLPCFDHKRWIGVILIAYVVMFSVFTFSPPEIPLFQDPTDGSYGYNIPLADR